MVVFFVTVAAKAQTVSGQICDWLSIGSVSDAGIDEGRWWRKQQQKLEPGGFQTRTHGDPGR